jgi:hypothetical protein
LSFCISELVIDVKAREAKFKSYCTPAQQKYTVLTQKLCSVSIYRFLVKKPREKPQKSSAAIFKRKAEVQ